MTELPKEDLEAFLAVRQEKGAGIEPALVESLAYRIEQTIQQRAAAELARHKRREVAPAARVAVCIISLVMAIPLTAIAAMTLGLPGVITTWTGLVLLNFALGGLPRR